MACAARCRCTSQDVPGLIPGYCHLHFSLLHLKTWLVQLSVAVQARWHLAAQTRCSCTSHMSTHIRCPRFDPWLLPAFSLLTTSPQNVLCAAKCCCTNLYLKTSKNLFHADVLILQCIDSAKKTKKNKKTCMSSELLNSNYAKQLLTLEGHIVAFWGKATKRHSGSPMTHT